MSKRNISLILGLAMILILFVFLVPSSVAQASSSVCSYEVQSGDNLSVIAQRFGQKVDTLVFLNKNQYPGLATNPDLIYPGWKIAVPCLPIPVTGIVKPRVVNVENSGPDSLVAPIAGQVYTLGDGKVGFFAIGTPGYKVHAWVDVVEAANKSEPAIEFFVYSPLEFQNVRSSWYEQTKVIQPTGSGTPTNDVTADNVGYHDLWYDGGQGSFKEPWWGLVVNRSGGPIKFTIAFEDQPAMCSNNFPCEETAEVY